DESLLYERQKHEGTLPIIGVNTFCSPNGPHIPRAVELARSTDEEKRSQLSRLADFHSRHAEEAPAALATLKRAATANKNVFACLMDTVRVASLGQMCDALFEVGGQYRRSM
ncbi:MAG: methylmalonyl-CoA mutase family protein, partial [Thermoleophilia bacterium]|nr:methylmalonyl-CoA mutase family protein [Thermoleophilia bacterium]